MNNILVPEDLTQADAVLKGTLVYQAACLFGAELFEVAPELFLEYGEQITLCDSVADFRGFFWAMAQELRNVPGGYSAYRMAEAFASSNEQSEGWASFDN